jgi:Zn-dependent protease with chaperone function
VNLAVYLPVLASAAIGLACGRLVRRTSPRAGAVALCGLALVAAAGSAWALLLLAGTLGDDGRRPDIASAPVPDPVALLATAGLVVMGVRLVAALRRRHRVARHLAAALADVPGTDGAGTVVLADARPEAYAVPGRWHPRRVRRRQPRIFVTAGMLRVLDPGQQRALFAHEAAHLDGRHHLLLAATDLAAAVNPLLGPVRRAVAFLCERSADERAAAETGDRGLVASAVAAAALARSGRATAAGALAFDRLGVVGRVTALGVPAPGRPRLVMLAAVALGAAIVAADAHATGEFLQLLRSVTGR